MECGQAVHEDRAVGCMVKAALFHLIRLKLMYPLGPYFLRLSHRYPHIGIDDIRAAACGLHVIREGDPCTGLRSHITRVLDQFLIGIVLR